MKTTINAFNAITEEAEKIPDFKDRMDFYKKCYPTFIGTYVFSYIGRLADHGYMNEIEDVSWTSAIRRILMITMVEVGGEFSITFLQNFETPKYADAIAKEMERLGITVSLLKKLNKRGDRGSLYVNIGVEIPKDLSREEKELYQKLAELRHDNETAQEESFLEKMKNLFK